MSDQNNSSFDDEPISLGPEPGDDEPISLPAEPAKSGDDEPISLTPKPAKSGDDEPISLTPKPVKSGDDEPISLADGPGEAPAGAPRRAIKPTGASAARPTANHDTTKRSYGTGLAQATERFQFKRPMNLNGTGATRCRVFHSKVAEAPMHVMENNINEWIDSEQIEVKQVGHCIGLMQGKTTEPNIVIVVWY